MADNLLDDDDDAEEGGSDEWLATFADMSTLLLTFFVLLVSMATFEKPRFADNFASVREAFGGVGMLSAMTEAQTIESASTPLDAAEARQRNIDAQKQLYKEIQTFLTRTAMSDIVRAKVDNDKITLSIPAEVLFAPGSEQMLSKAQPYLLALRELFLKERNQNVNIKGYTDNSPLPEGARFKDNWELSALRAVNILREMLDGGIEAVRLTATGLGDLNPLAPNTTEENRAMNRRVEFELERRAGNE